MNDGSIDNIWNADITSQDKSQYIISSKSYNSTIESNKNISFGFIAHGMNPSTGTFISMDDYQ